MSRSGDLDAIIVGAGAIGSALALALARDGFGVALVEARPSMPWRAEDDVDLRVVALAPDARGLLDDLGVWKVVSESRLGPYRHMRVWDALAPGALAFDSAERGEAALGWIVENKLIQHALWQALGGEEGPEMVASMRGLEAKPGSVRVCCPAAVAEVDNGLEAVTAILDDGTRLRGRILIAAEGAESSLRTKLGIAFKGHDYGQRAVVAHVATERPHESTAWQRFQPGGPLAFLPLADGRCSIVWSLRDVEAARILVLDDAAFRAELGCAFDFRLGAITATTPRASFPLRLRIAERYVAGRCILAGDAAHVVHPLAGQGMNIGFRDVSCLRRVLGEARKSGSDIGAAHVLRRYERERRSESVLAARGFDGVQRLFDTDAMPIAALRGLGLAAVNRLAPLKHFFADTAAGRH